MRVLQGPTLPGLSTTSSSFRHRNISYYDILVCFIIPDRPTYCSASNRRRQDVYRCSSMITEVQCVTIHHTDPSLARMLEENVIHHFQKRIACMIAYD